MPRILPVDIAAATGATATQLDATKKLLGSVPNMFATAAQSPATLTAMNGFFGALAKSSLGGKVGEQIAIAVAQANGCEYCLSAHTTIGGMHGLPAGALADARDGRADHPKTQAILSLALEIVDTRGRVSASSLESARAAGLTDGEIIDVAGHVALNIFTNYLNNLAGTTVDFPVVPLERAS